MSNKTFKVGDRVRCISYSGSNKKMVGRCGTIIYIEGETNIECDDILVEFDEFILGHDGCSLLSGTKGKAGHCWWLSVDELEPAHKFKVGDYVIGNQKNTCVITNKGWVGKVVKVHEDGKFDVMGKGFLQSVTTFEYLNPEEFDLYTGDQPNKIVITTDGCTTTAKMYRDKTVIGMQTTKCHPDDRFDFKEGARIAFDRLVGTPMGGVKEEPEKLKYKIGDKVIIESTNIDGIDDKFRGSVGEIINVDPTYRYPYLVRNHTSPKGEELWSTVSGYAPTYYNGKVVCVDNTGNCSVYTLGKIYQMVDGQLIDDKGYTFPTKTTRVKSFKEWQNRSSAKWLEVVE